MLKYILLASVVAISAPALAQSQSAPENNTPSTAVDHGQTSTQPAQDATAAPVGDGQVAQTAPAADPAQPAQAGAVVADAKPANKAEQVDAVVNKEFPTYDKDANGSLNKTEFAAWMVALKTASDPATKVESAEVKTWISNAFASADTDKSKSVSKKELEGFLSQGG